MSKKKRLTLFDGVSRGLWCPIRDPRRVDGIGMRGQDKNAFPTHHRENHLAVGRETRRTPLLEQFPCLGGGFCRKSARLPATLLQSARMNRKKVAAVAICAV